MILLGALANAVAIIIGGTVGTVVKKGVPEKMGNLIVSALGLVVFIIGVTFALKTSNIMIVIFSLIIGAVIGELIDIEKRLDDFAKSVQDKLKGLSGNFSQGFVTSSLLFCVGSMAIVGSLESGLNNNHTVLLTKSVLDLVFALIFASTMGIGVAASAIPVLIYQGGITLLASYVSAFLSTPVVTEMSATGGILLIGLALSILDIKKVKVGNLLPAIFIPIIIMLFYR